MITRDVGDGHPIGYEARDPDTRELVDATVSLTLTDPDGLQTNPSPTHPSTGVYHYNIPLTAAGLWRWKWTVTGAVIDVAYGEVMAADPAPADLATPADLVAAIGRSLTEDEAARAPGLLASASTKIRGFCRRSFTDATDDVVELRPVGLTLTLPNKPVTEVAQVQQIGVSGTADRVLPISEWAFDGIDKIDVCPSLSGGSYANTYRVTYSHTGPPQFVVDKAVEIVLRSLFAPTKAAGLVSERIGQYSYQYGQFPGAQSPGPTAVLTKDDKTDLREAGYRKSASTIQTQAA